MTRTVDFDDPRFRRFAELAEQLAQLPLEARAEAIRRALTQEYLAAQEAVGRPEAADPPVLEIVKAMSDDELKAVAEEVAASGFAASLRELFQSAVPANTSAGGPSCATELCRQGEAEPVAAEGSVTDGNVAKVSEGGDAQVRESADTGVGTLSVRVESEQEFFQRVKSGAQATAERHEGPVSTLSFETIGDLLALLTPERLELYEALKRLRQPVYIEELETLATELQREAASVSSDVRKLVDAGFLQLRDAVDEHQRRHIEIWVVPAQVAFRL